MPADKKIKSIYDVTDPKSVEDSVEYYPKKENGTVDIPAKTRIKITQYMHEHSLGKAEGSTQGVADKYPKDAVVSEQQLAANERKISPSVMKQSSNSSQFKEEISTTKFGSSDVAHVPDNIDPSTFDQQSSVESIRDNYISTVLQRNRWTSDELRSTTGAAVALPRSLTERDGSLKEEKTDYTTYTDNQVTSIGATLSARASIEKGSGEDGYDVNSAGSEAWAILPGMSQLAVKRPSVSRFDVKDIVEKSGASSPDFISVNEDSWGTMNSPIDKYSGNTSIGMTALAIALMLGMLVGIDLLSSILGMLHDDSDEKKATHGVLSDKGNRDEATKIYDLGKYKASATQTTPGFPPLPLDLTAYLGMVPTTNSWEKSVKKGMLVFFGSDQDPDGILGGTIGGLTGGDSFKAAASSPGFYIVFIRSVVRSSIVIFKQIKEVVSNIGSLFSSSPNVLDTFTSLLQLFDIIKRSKLMSALNLFARLGDQALDEDDNVKETVYDDVTAYSYSDSIPNNNRRATIMKSRLKNPEGKNGSSLAWGAGQAGIESDTKGFGTMLLVPQPTYEQSNKLGPSHSWLGKYNAIADGTRSKMQLVSLSRGAGSRIPTEAVEKLEAALDGTYVPFYFHDIRTNEIISFHAFLTTLSDQFSPDWNKQGGYGRTDPVYTYKATERKISIGFIVAATSEKDFQEMWIKINKLVTLVYPQYSEGSRLTADEGDTSFIQPFSQTFSASPLVRLRLGDLLRSNYSKFALARLFGLDSGEFKVKDSVDIKSNGVNKISDIIDSEREKNDYQGKTYTIKSSNIEKITLLKDSNGDIVNASLSNKISKLASEGQSLKVKITRMTDYVASIEFVSDNDPVVVGVTAQAPVEIIQLEKLIPVKTSSTDPETEFSQELSNLFSSDQNAIVRSFKSAGGRGLAGVINDLTFDFYENVTWNIDADDGKNTSYASQAPKMCRVTLSFSPIHDIGPGIDSLGFNRAPVYPVGHPYPRENDDGKSGGQG